MKQRVSLILFGLGMFGSGCASMVNKVDHDAIKQVRTVAVVGITYDQQAANSASTMLDNALGANDAGMMGKAVGEIKAPPHVVEAYGLLKASLESKKGWTLVDVAKTTHNPQVEKLYAKKHATIQMGVAPLRPQFYRYELANLPQFYYAKDADKAVLNAIASDLKADALVFVNASTRLSQSSVMGIGVGSIGSTTDIAFFVYDPKRGEFTVVMNASGDQSKTTDGKIGGFADKDTMNIQALRSYQSALDKALAEI